MKEGHVVQGGYRETRWRKDRAVEKSVEDCGGAWRGTEQCWERLLRTES